MPDSLRGCLRGVFTLKTLAIIVTAIAVGVVIFCLAHRVAFLGYTFALSVMVIYYNFEEIKDCCPCIVGYNGERHRPDDVNFQEPHGSSSQEDVPPTYNDVISTDISLPSYTEALSNHTV